MHLLARRLLRGTHLRRRFRGIVLRPAPYDCLLSGTESLVICGPLQLEIGAAAAAAAAIRLQARRPTSCTALPTRPCRSLGPVGRRFPVRTAMSSAGAWAGTTYLLDSYWSLGDAVCCSITSQTSLAPVADVLLPRRRCTNPGLRTPCEVTTRHPGRAERRERCMARHAWWDESQRKASSWHLLLLFDSARQRSTQLSLAGRYV